MRKIFDDQIHLYDHSIVFKFREEYKLIDQFLTEQRHLLERVQADLNEGKSKSKAGRPGMSADQVIRALIVKQLHSASYKNLEILIADSHTYREFCRYGPFDQTPRASTLQENLSKVKATTLESLNRSCIELAQKKRLKTPFLK